MKKRSVNAVFPQNEKKVKSFLKKHDIPFKKWEKEVIPFKGFFETSCDCCNNNLSKENMVHFEVPMSRNQFHLVLCWIGIKKFPTKKRKQKQMVNTLINLVVLSKNK